MRNDSELTLLIVMVLSGMCWFVIRFLWFVGESVVGAVRASLPKPEEHPLDWHGQPPPVCRSCGYDLRGSPERCSECGAELDPVLHLRAQVRVVLEERRVRVAHRVVPDHEALAARVLHHLAAAGEAFQLLPALGFDGPGRRGRGGTQEEGGQQVAMAHASSVARRRPGA